MRSIHKLLFAITQYRPVILLSKKTCRPLQVFPLLGLDRDHHEERQYGGHKNPYGVDIRAVCPGDSLLSPRDHLQPQPAVDSCSLRDFCDSNQYVAAHNGLEGSLLILHCAAWDQGSSSVIPSLPGFDADFGLSDNAKQKSDFISLVYVGAGIGAALSFFLNDKIGRLWSFRLYMLVWIIGQIIATFSMGNLGTLYAARIVSGLGIGALTVVGPMSLVEVAPAEIRGLIASWFSVVMLLSLTVSVFTVYGVFTQVATSRLQYQIVFFAPAIAAALLIGISFTLYESPRWLFLAGKDEDAIDTLVALRGLAAENPRVADEIAGIKAQIAKEQESFGPNPGLFTLCKDSFLVPANLRRVQQCLICYGLAQLSGANSVTSYLTTILSLVGLGGGTGHSLFISGMYSMSKFFYTLIASFFFIDALGRRRSLFTGITIQMMSDVYLGVYLKYKQARDVPESASQVAIAMIFIHGFGYAVGLLILPYVFGAELWPNHLRSFGSALSQTFHWLFFFGINKATPTILAETDNWGAFIFFAGWCLVSFVYVFVMVPETAGQKLENLDELFEGSWFSSGSWGKKKQKADAESGVIQIIESQSHR